MRLATIYNNGKETAGIVCSQGIYGIKTLNAYKGTAWETDIMSLIQTEEIPGLTYWYAHGGKEELETMPGVIPYEKVQYAPLYRNPQRIFGVIVVVLTTYMCGMTLLYQIPKLMGIA